MRSKYAFISFAVLCALLVQSAANGQILYQQDFDVDDTAFTPTTTAFETTATEATTDHYKDRIVLFVTGALAGQQKACTAYTLSGGRGKFTVDALTEAPGDGDRFILV